MANKNPHKVALDSVLELLEAMNEIQKDMEDVKTKKRIGKMRMECAKIAKFLAYELQ